VAKFIGNKDINVDVDVDVDVEEFYEEMSDDEKEEMAHLLSDDINILDFTGKSDREKMYKDLAYYVGVSDSEHLEYLIKELQYWSKK